MKSQSFKDIVDEIIEWNVVAGNTPENFNRHLESSILSEELSETIIALKDDNRVEIIDGVLDMFFIGVGTLYKKGFTSEQITQCMEEIISSNYTKFSQDINGEYKVITDDGGKVVKPDNFKKPDLEKYI